MNRLTLILCMAVALVTAVVTSLVWNAMGRSSVATCPVAVSAPAPVERPAITSGEELQALQDTIASQAQQIQILQDQITDLPREPVRVQPTAPPKSYMSQLEEEDPERHQRILERLKKTNDETIQAIADVADFLFNLDMNLMTPEQQQNHQKLLGLMENSWTLVDRMQENPQSQEESEDQAQLHQNVRAMQKAFKTERRAALEQWLQRQGFNSEQASALRVEIEEVYTKTDSANIIPGVRFIGDHIMISAGRTVE